MNREQAIKECVEEIHHQSESAFKQMVKSQIVTIAGLNQQLAELLRKLADARNTLATMEYTPLDADILK